MQSCVLLNADYTFLNVVDWKKAMRLIVKGKVQVVRYSENIIRSSAGAAFKIPIVMRLIKLIRTLYRNRVPFSKKNVLTRDRFKCAYCGLGKVKLTVDHIIPLSRNGKTSFENCVASCKGCNNKKGNRTPSEAGMYLKVKPFQPTIAEFLKIKISELGIDNTLKELGVY